MVKGIKNGKRRNYRTVDEKVAMLRRHIVDKVPVSDLCDEYGIQPRVVHGWHRQLIDNMGAALEVNGRKSETRAGQLERENEALRAKLAKKDGIIAEISEEHVAIKKRLGSPERAVDRASRQRCCSGCPLPGPGPGFAASGRQQRSTGARLPTARLFGLSPIPGGACVVTMYKKAG